MSDPQPATPAKLVTGFFLSDKRLAEPIVSELVEYFGPIDMVSPWFSFEFTSYYEKEMGPHLVRRMIAFKNPIHQDALADIKLCTNRIENRYLAGGQRRVNIDPGYMLQERFVLGTGKNFTHRIYIGHGIYADLTLIYQKGAFRTLPWTYPDYAHKDLINWLVLVRRKHAFDLKSNQGTQGNDKKHDRLC